MERYTEWKDGHGAGLPGKDCYTQLARYEDTGLITEEVLDLNGCTLALPCKFGSHLFRITTPYRGERKVTEYIVKNFRTTGKRHRIQIEVQAVGVPVTN